MTLRIRTAIAAIAALLAAVSCGDVLRQGRSPAFLVIDGLEAASGAKPGEFGVPLLSDVLTKGSIYDDVGHASIRVLLKDQGTGDTPAKPSNINVVTITRYHVQFVRSDGRNIEGVDVPFAFDGATTATVTDTTTTVPFELVRHAAKVEAPLKSLANIQGRILISTIAEVTFYGRDQAGNEVQATGSISVDFGDFADPTT